ncbi:hypothetical protein GGR28_000848 [Lewinella aquimaris]|uniref:Quinol:cytochrome C oxidoreductase n=1 Tax=Neolewinella aquimaris TaxID=1835722 RepID=A0A840E532_9BACT|nr:hypothetical protein [Neolewinella aquimaris]MBB4078247.1 hypothetical protein [Neolewinella aquimaris]
MENFVFSSRAKTTNLVLMGVGLVCLVLSYFADGGEGHHMRFWTNFLHNSVFFLGIAALAGFALAAFTTAYAGWFVQFKRVWESFAAFLLPGLFLMGVIIVGIWTHTTHLYHWNDEAAVLGDAILTHKSSFLNKWWFTFGTIGFVGLWYFLLGKMRNISIAEDNDTGDKDFSYYRRYKKYAAIFLPIFGFTSAAMIWQWIMSIDSHWYSTMFAWYATASLFVAMTALTIMLLIYLKSRGYYLGVNEEHFHDLGKYLFAISIFWTYLWFSQYMLIWYANIGEETIYFRERLDNYPVLFWLNLGINFALPFFILMRNDTKRKMGTLFFASAFVFFGHWLDYFNMIKPGARLTLVEMAAHEGGHGEEDHATMDHGGETDTHAGEAAAIHEEADPEEKYADATQLEQGTNLQPADATTGSAIESPGRRITAAQPEAGVPVATDFRGGPPTGDGTEGPREFEAIMDRNEVDVFEPNHFIQEEYVEDTEMIGHLEEAGSHLEEGHTLAFKSGYTLPGLLEIGTFLGFLGGFLYFVMSSLTKARLEPKHDPYLEESIHHHT